MPSIMPNVWIDHALEMYYEDQDFTGPWRAFEAIFMQHGNDTNENFWFGRVPLLVGDYQVAHRMRGTSGGPQFHPPVTSGLLASSPTTSECRWTPLRWKSCFRWERRRAVSGSSARVRMAITKGVSRGAGLWI